MKALLSPLQSLQNEFRSFREGTSRLSWPRTMSKSSTRNPYFLFLWSFAAVMKFLQWRGSRASVPTAPSHSHRRASPEVTRTMRGCTSCRQRRDTATKDLSAPLAKLRHACRGLREEKRTWPWPRIKPRRNARVFPLG